MMPMEGTVVLFSFSIVVGELGVDLMGADLLGVVFAPVRHTVQFPAFGIECELRVLNRNALHAR